MSRLGGNERTNEQKSPVFYRTLSPSGLLPKKPDLRSERAKLRLKWADFRSFRADFRPERLDLRSNRSPKGNIWSAIPVPLLWMILNWSEGKQGSGPEGDKVL